MKCKTQIQNLGSIIKRIVGIITFIFLLSSSLSFAKEVEKKGSFRIEGDTIIVNDKDRIRTIRDTRIVNKDGDRVELENIKYAKIIIVETDEKGNVKMIIITEWED